MITVSALEPTYATFYEAEFIDDVYMNKYNYETNTIHYQKARFFRKEGTGEFAYCIEPLRFFEEGTIYEEKESIDTLSEEKLNKIKKIAHFGYQYKSHTEAYWYAVTQMMIWQEVGSEYGSYYFTDSLNGNRTDMFQGEIDEINNLIYQYDLNIINNTEYQVLEDQSIAYLIGDLINNYQSDSENIEIKNGNLILKNLKEGYYEFTLTRLEDSNNPILFYQSSNSQNLMDYGGIENKDALIKVTVNKSNITIHKIDEGTKEETPQGEAELDGAIYGLYKERNDKLLKTIEINNNEAILENVAYGTYYIKEISPGKGYQLDERKYPLSITNREFTIQLELENKIIEKKITIIKKFGEENNLLEEKDICFEIYNYKNEIVKTVTTNEQGIAVFILPYGTYTIKQINSTEGYEKVEDRIITVNDLEDETIELTDYKIAVPDTYSSKKNFLHLLIELIIKWIF